MPIRSGVQFNGIIRKGSPAYDSPERIDVAEPDALQGGRDTMCHAGNHGLIKHGFNPLLLWKDHGNPEKILSQ
jgi:hypothetical protein